MIQKIIVEPSWLDETLVFVRQRFFVPTFGVKKWCRLNETTTTLSTLRCVTPISSCKNPRNIMDFPLNAPMYLCYSSSPPPPQKTYLTVLHKSNPGQTHRRSAPALVPHGWLTSIKGQWKSQVDGWELFFDVCLVGVGASPQNKYNEYSTMWWRVTILNNN